MYTREQTEKIRNFYKEQKDLGAETDSIILELIELFGVTRKSIIAKLSSMGLYKRQEYRTKTGERPTPKEKYVEEIARLLGKDITLVDSLEKVNKYVLKLLVERLSENK